MAILTKPGSRRPLAAGPANVGWRNMPTSRGAEPAELFTLNVEGFALSLTRIEAEDLHKRLGERLADPELLKAAGL